MASTSTSLFFFFFSSLIWLLHLSSAQNNAVKGGYWSSRTGFPVSDVDSTLFTHLFCAFADLDLQTNRVVISPSNQPQFSSFTATVQRKNPSVKTLLSVGGGSADEDAFAAMASGPNSRRAFIDSSIALARANGFHGLDLDWENLRSTAEFANLGTLLTELRAAVAAEAGSSGKPALLLTAAVSYSPGSGDTSYPTRSLSRSLDWINAMAYDFSDPRRSPVTRSHAALYDPGRQLSASYGVEAWVSAGMQPEKIVLGVPFYGYAWQLVNGANHGLYAPANGPVGSQVDGSMGYKEIVGFMGRNKAQVVYNATMVTAYAYAGTTWIGFDGERTVSTKATYAKTKGLRGYFAWNVGSDDDQWVLSRAASRAWGA